MHQFDAAEIPTTELDLSLLAIARRANRDRIYPRLGIDLRSDEKRQADPQDRNVRLHAQLVLPACSTLIKTQGKGDAKGP